MSILKTFNKLPWWKCILLLIPVVNWVTEILVRGSAFLNGKATLQLIFLILAILPTGVILGWVDFFCCLILGRLSLT